jgi:hypothetical protein
MCCFKAKPLLALCLGWAALWIGQAAAQQPEKGSSDRLQALWGDLANEDESKASRALLLLTASPKETVAFLQLHLRPVKVEAEQVARLLADLDNPKFTKREAAAKELEYLGKFAKPLLEKHLKDSTSAEVKRRLKDLLGRIPPDPSDPAEAKPAPAQPLRGRGISVSSGPGGVKIVIDGQEFDLSKMNTAPAVIILRPNADWQRAMRAVAVLEHLATPEAKQVLQTMARGERDAPPTKAAREALERLGK